MVVILQLGVDLVELLHQENHCKVMRVSVWKFGLCLCEFLENVGLRVI